MKNSQTQRLDAAAHDGGWTLGGHGVHLATVRPIHSRRREFCHFTGIPSPPLLKHLLKGEEGAAEMTSLADG